ncbi:calcium-binding protein, partial [Microvirga sp. BT688]|nr:calcium-binding protein [Microvirga sp.]
DAYLSTYTDVAAAGVNPLAHYLKYGVYEGRSTFGDSIIA